MSDQVHLPNNSAMNTNARRVADPKMDSPWRQPSSDEWIDRIEDQINHGLDTHLTEQALRILTADSRRVERDRLIRLLRGQLIERKLYATWLESEVESRNQRISELFEQSRQASDDFRQAEAELAALRSSLVRHALSQTLERIIRALRAIRRRVHMPGTVMRSLRQRLGLLRSPGDKSIAPDVPVDDANALEPLKAPTIEECPARVEQERPVVTRDRNDILQWIPPRRDPYELWLQNQSSSMEEQIAHWKQLENRPTFSVIVPQDHTNLRQLRETVASVRRQSYPDRDVVLVGGSELAAVMTDGQTTVVSDDPRRVESIQTATEQSASDYLVFVNHCAILHEEALLEFARTIDATQEPLDLIFADEDRIEANGHRFDPRFRPEWSPELMLAYQAVGGMFAVRRSIFEMVGGLRPEFGQAWPYDLVLRIAEQSDRIVRVPRVLSSVPANRTAEDPVDCCSVETIRHSALALDSALRRRGIDARIAQPAWASRLRVPAFELDFPDRGPKVAILIPTRDRVDLLHRCLESIRERTTYQDYEIVVIDNGSQEEETLEYFAQLDSRCRVIRIENDESGFSYAKIHNQAIENLENTIEFVVLLNNDTEVVRSEWLSQLVGYGKLPGVGAVGARLLYPDGRLQHVGIVTDLFDGAPGHLFKGLPWWHTDLQFFERVARNVSAVTAACLLVKKDTYLKIGGFDEHQFAVGFNDVDFCLRLAEIGLRCVYAPRAELFHFEGASRGFTLDPQEEKRFLERWGHRTDPYYHPALIRDDHQPGISTRPMAAPESLGDQPIRVLIDLGRLDGRGSSRFVRNLIEGYRHRGKLAAEVCCRIDGAMGTMLRNEGFPVSVVPIDDRQPIADRIQILADHFDHHDYDLIHVIGLDQYSTLHAARLARIPSIWTIREAVDFRDAFLTLDRDGAHTAIQAFSEASRVVFPARRIRNLYTPLETCWNFETVREAGRPVSELPERDDARRWFGLSRSTIVLACLHDTEEDQIGMFLDQRARLVRSDRDVVALILGVPELGQWLTRTEPSRLHGSRVRFISMFEDFVVNNALAAADVIVDVSQRDLSPEIVSIKKELCKPLIQSEVIGIDEYVRADPTVVVFDPTQPETLLARLESILDSPPLEQAWRREGRKDREYEKMILAYERLALEAIWTNAKRSQFPERRTLGVA
ncbi:glycosyltransferase [Tautonia marina]|uniref:glycosyltransferase n=1 Tax=Tautonia marina TaxID=2653855 RepID=UPI00137580AA|nr:glycosyltransferase [Tautonia marina]